MKKLLFCLFLAALPIAAQAQLRYLRVATNIVDLVSINPLGIDLVAFTTDTGQFFRYYPSDTTATNTTTIFKPLNFSGRWKEVALLVPTSSLANPSGLIGLSAVNGSATTGLRSDGRHALDQSISPDWTGTHTFENQIQFGPGSTNYLIRESGGFNLGFHTSDAAKRSILEFHNSNTGNAASVGMSGDGSALLQGTISVSLSISGDSLTFQSGDFESSNNDNLGRYSVPWGTLFLNQTNFITGYRALGPSSSTNFSAVTISHGGTNSNVIYNSVGSGIAGPARPQIWSMDGAGVFTIDATSGASTTGLLIYENGTAKRVTIGAADSGGTGFRVLRIPN